MSDLPAPEDNKKDTDDLVTAIWQAGWKSGDKHGYDLGYTNGKSVFSRFWTVTAILFAFGFGAGLGYTTDWVQTCQPILATDVKSCETRFGND